MRTWKFKNGDIATDTLGRIEEVSGANKVVQDLRFWLLNDVGYNKNHPEMGTDLDDFVGQVVTATTLSDIRTTIRNALNTYMDMQMDDLRKRVEERGDPRVAIGAAEPSSMVKDWTKLDIRQIGGDVIVNVGFRTFTGDYEEVRLAISGGLDNIRAE